MMEINIAKAAEIDSFIKDNGDCKQPNILAVELKGERKLLEIYRLPIELLIYNKRNGRFAAEMIQKEAELKRTLDPMVDDDRKIIKKLLLEEDENATLLLKDDLVKVGQLEPGIITFDGVVINGNRRMAALEDLFEEKDDSKYGFLLVARLPKNVEEEDIYRLEIGIQLSRPYRKDYGPINELLKLQEGIKIGLVPKKIANSLFGGFKEHDIKERLDRLKLIDTYLEYIGKPKQYEEVKGWHEHFIDLQNAISNFKNKKMSAKEIHYATIAGFQLIIAGVPHMDVRRIKPIMDEKKTKQGLMGGVEKVIKESEGGPKEGKKEEKKGKEIITPSKEEKTKTLTKIAGEFKEDFENLKDTHKALSEKNKPKILLKRVLSNLESINTKPSTLKDPEVIKLLKNIDEIIKKLLGKL